MQLKVNGRRTGKSLLSTLTVGTLFVISVAAYAQPTPIGVTGFNRDVITDTTATSAKQFDSTNDSWFVTGTKDSVGTVHNDGLPKTGKFTSAFTNTVTGGHTTFSFASYTKSNTLFLNTATPTGTLTLKTPAKYSSISILAATANGTSTSTGSLILNYTDGTSSGPISFNAFDWDKGTTDKALSLDVARNKDANGNFVYDTADGKTYNMFETDINTSMFGGKFLEDITFTKSGTAGATGIFAVSGLATPEPSVVLTMLMGMGFVMLAVVRRKKVSSN